MNHAACRENATPIGWTYVALALAALLFFARFGYDYAGSDQDEWIPQVLRHFDPQLFSADWFITAQKGFGIRSAMVWVCTVVAYVAPVWLAVLLIHVGSFVLLFVAISRITLHLAGGQLAALASPVVALVMTPQWTLGGNDLIHAMLVPSTLAWGLGLSALVPALKGRVVTTGVLLALAVAFQPLVGLQLAFVYFAALALTSRGTGRLPVRRVLQMVVVFVALSVPIATALFLGQQPTTEDAPDPVWMREVLAGVRAPHHYDFRSFPMESYVRFGGLVATMLTLLVVPGVRGTFERRQPLAAIVAVSVILLLVGFVASPLVVAFQAQLFKQSILLKVLAAIVICTALSTAFGRSISALEPAGSRRVRRFVAATIILIWLAVGVGLIAGVEFLRDRVRPLARSDTPAAAVERWARASTSVRAVFAVPPSDDRFRSNARRSIVVNFKSVPFDPAGLSQWYDRLGDMAEPLRPARDASETLSRLDAAYNSKTPAELVRLADQYDITHIVRTSAVVDHLRLRPAFQSGPYMVYEILDASGTEQ